MKEINNVLICGLGAIGCIYAAKIQKFNPDNLKILVDKKRYKNYIKNPLTFNGEKIQFNYVLPDEKEYKADLIIIATKNNGLIEAVKNIKNFVHKDTIIISLLNGIDSENYIAEYYGKDKIVYSYFIGHSAFRNGRQISQDGVYSTVFGTIDNNVNADILKDYFDKTGIKYQISEDIIYSMWLKFALNISANQVSAILHLTFGEMLKNKECMELFKNIITEVQSIAIAENIKNADRLIEDAMSALNKMSPDGKTSMLQDIEAKRKTEVDIFAGKIIELGQKHNIPTPYNTCLYNMIKIIEKTMA